MAVYGLWYGGASYSWGEPDTDLEVFPSITHAREALRDRYDSNGQRHCEVRYADGRQESTLFPAVEQAGTQIHLFLSDPRGSGEFYPDRIIRFGVRGGVLVERC